MAKLPCALIAASFGLLTLCLTSDAKAECTTLSFAVNDYGKEGPAKDAQNLLDKYIAKWAANKGIKKYTSGKKDVKCELYLDLIAFDEYTCHATSKVCW